MSVYAPDQSEALAASLADRGFDRYVVKAADGIFILLDAASAISLMVSDPSDATLYAAFDDGEATRVAAWNGVTIAYDQSR